MVNGQRAVIRTRNLVKNLPLSVVPHVLPFFLLGQLALLEGVLDQLVLGLVGPRARELVLVEDAELHVGLLAEASAGHRGSGRVGAAVGRPVGVMPGTRGLRRTTGTARGGRETGAQPGPGGGS